MIPKYKNKHLFEASFDPIDFIRNYKGFKNKGLPKKYIITYPTSVLSYFRRKYKPQKIKFYSLLTIYKYKDIGLVRLTGGGSPLASAILEELIALGGKKFLNIGTAGGLFQEGVFICNKALRDEGTSYHYLPKGHYTYPDKNLTDRLKKSLKKHHLKYKEGITWTIDAPYRETKKEVEKYSKMGITNVEMEASSLFAVAKYRKVKIASAFVVSDVLGDKWLPKFHRFDVKRSLNKLIDIAVDCLIDLK